MSINVSQAFHRTSANAVDDTLTLTKVQMLTVNDNLMPDKYFTICQDDGAVYLYDKSATPNAETGKFKKFEGGDDGVVISQADFNALPQSEKDNGETYYIYDGDELVQQTVMGYTPIGTIISVMGNSAPRHYLACDGSIVNIVDYPELAVYFEEQFGSKNYFGGDGETTFAVPDLRGEFLRGTGTNSHEYQGSGGDVGEHQNATGFPPYYIAKTGNQIKLGLRYPTNISSYSQITNADIQVEPASGDTNYAVTSALDTNTASAKSFVIGSRPTNTSVLYCIATKNIYTNPENIYSTDEQVVGQWIDGKPIYQKTIDCDRQAIPVNAWTVLTNITMTNVDKLIESNAMYVGNNDAPKKYATAFSINANNSISVNRYNGVDSSSSAPLIYITLQYTKTTD